jgi:hypothetical protein
MRGVDRGRMLGSSTGCLQTDRSLEGIVNPPLQTSQSTDHENPCTETSPESLETNLAIYLRDLLAERSSFLSLAVKFANHGVGWVRDDGTEDTCKVTGGESHSQLGWFGVGLLTLGEDVVVEHLNKPFEGDEFYYSVWDLPGPKWSQSLVKAISAFNKYIYIPSSARSLAMAAPS